MAATSLVLPTSDLRSEAKSFQRDKNHITKWQNGAAAAPGKRCAHADIFTNEACADCAARPLKPTGTWSGLRREMQRQTQRSNTANRKVLSYDVDDALDDLDSDRSSDAGELAGVSDPNEAEIMYSFDAPTGPSRGDNILSYALTKAVQRFENTETEKLIRKEYDVVEDTKTVADGYEAEIDSLEYDIIDISHLE